MLCLGVELTQKLYVPWVGQRHSIFCGEANASGPAYLCNLEGPLPAGGEFVEPRSVQDPSEDEVASPELPTVHEPLMIAPERLVVACISDCCSPPSLVNEVHVVAPQLLQAGGAVPRTRGEIPRAGGEVPRGGGGQGGLGHPGAGGCPGGGPEAPGRPARRGPADR